MSQTKLKKGHVGTFTVNPKCVKLGELYGETDPNTFEWSDGLIASATRRLAKEQQPALSDDINRPSTSQVSVRRSDRVGDAASGQGAAAGAV